MSCELLRRNQQQEQRSYTGLIYPPLDGKTNGGSGERYGYEALGQAWSGKARRFPLGTGYFVVSFPVRDWSPSTVLSARHYSGRVVGPGPAAVSRFFPNAG
jgi:hypothetical protein